MEIGTLLPDEQFLLAAIGLITSAEKSIYISTFKAEITTKPRGRRLKHFFDDLIEKARLGLDVRFITNRRQNFGHVPATNLYAVTYLKKTPIKVRHLLNDRICHAKLIIIDDCTAIIGSHNLSVKSCQSNFEMSYMLRDFYIVGNLKRIYELLWENAVKA